MQKAIVVLVLFFTATVALAGWCTPPFITSAHYATAKVGQPFSYTATTTVRANITYGYYPSWLTPSNNTISGVPTEAGTYVIVVQASNHCGTAVINLTIEVE